MKSIKVFAMVGLLSGFADAATVTVSQGVGAQGYTVLVAGLAPASFSWAAGNWNAGTSTWTQFGATQTDTAKINGSVTATGPTSLNSQIIDIFVGSASTIAGSGDSWVILRTNVNAFYPSDVTTAPSVPVVLALTNASTIVGTGNAGNGFQTIGATGGNLNLVPEPSAALLGALGVLGLLRRRRI